MPRKWGIYTLEQELGRGGMAVVYKASKIRDGGFRREVCLKQILPSLSDDPEFVKMFKQEARIAASLRHPNIVTVTDFGRLEVNCRPWAEINVDGREVGTTPIKNLRVRAGKRRVTLRNDKLGYARTFTVDVPKGGVGSLVKDITAAGPVADPSAGE